MKNACCLLKMKRKEMDNSQNEASIGLFTITETTLDVNNFLACTALIPQIFLLQGQLDFL